MALGIDMGWCMALNLRKNLPKSSKLFIYDIVTSILDKFAENAQTNGLGEVIICKSAREVAENAVGRSKDCNRTGLLKKPTGNYFHYRARRQARP